MYLNDQEIDKKIIIIILKQVNKKIILNQHSNHNININLSQLLVVKHGTER